MSKYILILGVMLLVVQLEVFALLLLDKQNLGVWRAQTELNEQLVNAAVNQCML